MYAGLSLCIAAEIFLKPLEIPLTSCLCLIDSASLALSGLALLPQKQ